MRVSLLLRLCYCIRERLLLWVGAVRRLLTDLWGRALVDPSGGVEVVCVFCTPRNVPRNGSQRSAWAMIVVWFVRVV